MPSQRQRIRMTDDEVERFLDEERTVQMATIGPDGAPHLVPMWYAVVDGRIAMWTYATSQKLVNLRRDPRITCLVEAGGSYGELRGVSVTGTVELDDDPAAVLRVGEAIYSRYRGDGGDMSQASRAHLEAESRKRVAVLVNPTRTATWDHRKL